MKYIDGFLMVVPKKKLAAYKKLAQKAGKVWMDLGALDYHECVGEDVQTSCGIAFQKRANAGKGDLVVFSWVTYKSRKHRDQVNAKIMQDPRMLKMMRTPMPFDMKKMSHGGFDVIVDL
jgi:uncharacterized protein YbaA (DUF1428 family)